MEIIVAGIKFKPVGKIYYFDPKKLKLKEGEGVIVITDNGPEYGEVVYASKKVKKSEITGELKKIIRLATDKDYEVLEANNAQAVEDAKTANNLIKKHNLDMKLIDAEYSFDGNKVIFTFTAEGRVDFRELVKELASVLKTRIELRQVGARDASKIIGGLGPCGRAICCANHMREFNKVSIKMAKTQHLALNPSKINGVCGRLMCCLAYENESYTELNKTMPKVGKRVITPEGEGVAIYNNLLKQLVTVRFDGDGLAYTKEFIATDVKRKDPVQNNQRPSKPDKCKECPKQEEALEKSVKAMQLKPNNQNKKPNKQNKNYKKK